MVKMRLLSRVLLALLVVLMAIAIPAADANVAYDPDHYHSTPSAYFTYRDSEHCQCNSDSVYRDHLFTNQPPNNQPVYSEYQHKCYLCGGIDDHVYERTGSARCVVASNGGVCQAPNYTFPGGGYANATQHICWTCGYVGLHHFTEPGSILRAGEKIKCFCGYECPHSALGDPKPDGHLCNTCGWRFSHTFTADGDNPRTQHKCNACGYHEDHSFVDGVCTKCGYKCSHFIVVGSSRCDLCGKCWHYNWTNGKCVSCGIACPNTANHTCAACGTCGFSYPHDYSNNGGNHKCSVCNTVAEHSWYGIASGHNCWDCDATGDHQFGNGVCTTCGYTCSHLILVGTGRCGICNKCFHTNWTNGKCDSCGIVCPNSAN